MKFLEIATCVTLDSGSCVELCGVGLLANIVAPLIKNMFRISIELAIDRL